MTWRPEFSFVISFHCDVMLLLSVTLHFKPCPRYWDPGAMCWFYHSMRNDIQIQGRRGSVSKWVSRGCCQVYNIVQVVAVCTRFCSWLFVFWFKPECGKGMAGVIDLVSSICMPLAFRTVATTGITTTCCCHCTFAWLCLLSKFLFAPCCMLEQDELLIHAGPNSSTQSPGCHGRAYNFYLFIYDSNATLVFVGIGWIEMLKNFLFILCWDQFFGWPGTF